MRKLNKTTKAAALALVATLLFPAAAMAGGSIPSYKIKEQPEINEFGYKSRWTCNADRDACYDQNAPRARGLADDGTYNGASTRPEDYDSNSRVYTGVPEGLARLGYTREDIDRMARGEVRTPHFGTLGSAAASELRNHVRLRTKTLNSRDRILQRWSDGDLIASGEPSGRAPGEPLDGTSWDGRIDSSQVVGEGARLARLWEEYDLLMDARARNSHVPGMSTRSPSDQMRQIKSERERLDRNMKLGVTQLEYVQVGSLARDVINNRRSMSSALEFEGFEVRPEAFRALYEHFSQPENAR